MYDFKQNKGSRRLNNSIVVRPLLFRSRKIKSDSSLEDIVYWNLRIKKFKQSLYKATLLVYENFLKIKGHKFSLKELAREKEFPKEFMENQGIDCEVMHLPGMETNDKIEFVNKSLLSAIGKRHQTESKFELAVSKKLKNSGVSTKVSKQGEEKKVDHSIKNLEDIAIMEMVMDKDGVRRKMKEQEIEMMIAKVRFPAVISFRNKSKSLLRGLMTSSRRLGSAKDWMSIIC